MPAKKAVPEKAAVADSNAGASPQSVANSMAGTDGNGNALPYALAAMLYDSNLFGLPKDYAFTEGPNVSASRLDQITTQAKLWTRKRKMADGNDYDAHDALFTCLKWVLSQNVHINDDEKNSVNHTASVPVSAPAPRTVVRGNPHPSL